MDNSILFSLFTQDALGQTVLRFRSGIVFFFVVVVVVFVSHKL